MNEAAENFNEEQRKRIADYLNSKGALDRPCPRCGHDDFHVPGFLRHPLFLSPTDTQTRFVMVTMVVVCGHCKYVMQHGAADEGFPELV